MRETAPSLAFLSSSLRCPTKGAQGRTDHTFFRKRMYCSNYVRYANFVRNTECGGFRNRECKMYRHYTAVRSVPRKLHAIEGFSHKGESVKRGSTVLEQEHYLEVFFVERYKYVCKGMLDYREIFNCWGSSLLEVLLYLTSLHTYLVTWYLCADLHLALTTEKRAGTVYTSRNLPS